MKQKRENKTKKQIANEIELTSEANRKRELIRSVLFPFIKNLGGDVRFAKIFLHTASTALDSTFDKGRLTVKVKDLKEETMKLFGHDGSEEQKKRVAEYSDFFDLLGEESLTSFNSMVRDLPDNIERLAFTESEKRPITDIDIDKVLG